MTDNWLDRYNTEVAVPPAEREQAEREAPNFPVLEKSPNALIEKAQERHEENVEASKDQRWPDRPDWAEDEKSRKINPMHYMEFLFKCRSVGVEVTANEWSRLGRIGINGTSHGVWRTITTLQHPFSYEYTVMRFNEYRVPTNEKFRGYRTALLHLIEADVMTTDQAERAFGPAQGPAAIAYNKEIQRLKTEGK